MTEIKKVILLGSGGLSIGQAGEFDYSGFQAIRSLEEEGIEVIVVNPNIATVQTTPSINRKVYLYPVEPEWVEKIIETEKPQGIIAGFGGQTALNCVIQLDESGVLKKYNVQNFGTPIEILRLTEDRDLFAKKMMENEIPIPQSVKATSVDEALNAAKEIGFPVIARAAFALGGLGSGFARNSEELKELVEKSFSFSPQVLIEKSLRGWREIEVEVMRDSFGNAITICNMENLDPLGIHTGDSIVVAPSQTLTDREYQLLRSISLKIVHLLNIVGECNVQFALNPESLEFNVIEINARLSRSSALASKATGYPIAFIAAKVVLGKSLLQIKNPMTEVTSAYFEPALDYVVVKIPRWDLSKFKGASREIGTAMKSVGEVMAIGRSFPEAMQKAVRMVTEDECGISSQTFAKVLAQNSAQILEQVGTATDTRIFNVLDALRMGITVQEISQTSQIDSWFVHQLSEMIENEREISKVGRDFRVNTLSDLYQEGAFTSLLRDHLGRLSADTWKQWKSMGFGDEQIATLWFKQIFSATKKIQKNEIQNASFLIRKFREQLGISPVIRKIDTSAAEFHCNSNYLYFTYNGSFNDEVIDAPEKKKALVLGGGSYRVGSSVEFDWCAVNCVEKVKEMGWSASVINFNPETVSTDFNVSDRLYFEEMTLERILDIIEFEKSDGVILSMGGQLPNRLAQRLAQAGVPLLGHSWKSIDQAEDREKFSELLDRLDILQPPWVEAKSRMAIEEFISQVGYPVLIRPSYVLSGSAMNVAVDEESLNHFLSLAQEAHDVSQDYPIILSQYYKDAREVELDGVAKSGVAFATLVSEHIENAGVHSGDATLVFPPQTLKVAEREEIERIGKQISSELNLNGPFNIQYLVRDGEVRVIECNVRASRSFPFVSKVSGTNMIHLATEAMIGFQGPPPSRHFQESPRRVGVKSAMFSFQRLAGADPVLGVEMASTGEVACLGRDVNEAILLSFQASGIKVPRKGVLMSAGRREEKHKLLSCVQILKQMGIPIYATSGTARFFAENGYVVDSVEWTEIIPTVTRLLQDGCLDFVVNIPKNYSRTELSQGCKIRMWAINSGCTLLTNAEKANAFLSAIHASSHTGTTANAILPCVVQSL